MRSLKIGTRASGRCDTSGAEPLKANQKPTLRKSEEGQSRHYMLQFIGCFLSSMLVFSSWPVARADSGIPASPSLDMPGGQFFDTTDKSFVSKYLPSGSYMPVSDVKPGMTGYGLSVFQGMKIEKFDVQVIGTVKKFLNGRDAILVKLSGPAMANNCVIRGMSGSPIYINEKLIGAVSFGFDFSKEPIAGVTPVVDMLDSLADCNEKTPISKLNLSPLEISKGGPNGQAMIVPTAVGGLKPIPLLSPIGLSGFSARAEKFLSAQFGEYGLQVSSGASGGTSPGLSSATIAAAAKEIKPGAAASVLLSSGDFTSAGTGTVTARFGNKVIAFGHPMMSAGSVEFPLSTAFVHKVIPSLHVSFKLASPVTEVGTLTADRPWSVGGQIGKTAKMIPVSFTVVDEVRKIKRIYNCKVVDHPQMTPSLLAATTMSAIDATHQFSGPYVAKVSSVVEADGIEPIVRQDCFGSNITPHSIFEQLFSMMMGDPIAAYVHRTANSIVDNDYQKASIKSFKLKITLQDGRETANIDRIYVEKPYAAPGEQVKVMCILRPYNQEPRIETLSFQIPRDAADGNLPIAVAGGDQLDYIRGRLGIADPEPDSLKEIVDDIRKQSRGDELNLVVGLPEQTLIIGNTKINDPPSHWSKVLFSNRHTNGPRIVKREVRSSKLTDYLLSGSHVITVEVRSHDKATANTNPAFMPVRAGGDDPMMTEAARKALGSSSAYRGKSQASGVVPALQGTIGSSSTSTSSSSSSSSTSSTKSATATGLFSPKGKGYPHTRLHQIWRQETEEDFHDGKTEGSTVDSWGRVGPGLNNVATKAIGPDQEVWSGVWSNGYFYYSTGDKVWRWKGDDSAVEQVADLKAKIIPALAADSHGTVYAAAVPSGEVFALGSGAPHVVFKSPDSVITRLAFDDKDVLYVGTAGNGRVYKVDKGVSSMLFDSGQAHVTALFFSTHDGKLYVGTAERGAVYSIDRATGKAKALYQAPDHIVTGVVRTKKGDLYVSSASQGRLIRVLPSGEAQSLASSEAFYTLHYDVQNDLVFAGDAEGDITMACIEPTTEQPFFIPTCHTEQEAVLALASNGTRLFAGSSNLSVLKAFNISPSAQPRYESKVKDGGRTADWARLRVAGPFTEVVDKGLGARLKVETRTGETSKADETWSPWSASNFDGESYVLASPAGRFLQYRFTWLSPVALAVGQSGPQIGRVDVVYQPKDIAPAFSTISLKAGGTVAGKQDVTISGTDADGDNMLCTIDISSDGGSTWQKLVTDLRPKNAKKESSSKDGSKDSKESSKDSKESTKDSSKDDKDAKKKSETSTDKSDKPDKAKDDKSKDDSKDTGKPEAKESQDKKQGKESKEKQSRTRKDKGKSKSGKGNSSSDGDSPVKLQSPSPSDSEDKSADDNKSDDSKAEDGKSDDKKDDDNAAKDEDKSDKKDTDEKKDKDDKSKKSKKTPKSGSASIDPVGTGSKAEAGGSSSESFSYNWDTSKIKDGAYILKFTLDDRMSNPGDHQRTINVRAVTVDNSPPEIELMECKRTGGDKVECKVTARDKFTPIANATYRVDDGEPFALAATPHTLDGLSSVLVVPDLKCGPGSHKIEVKVSDRAGNTSTKTTNIK